MPGKRNISHVSDFRPEDNRFITLSEPKEQGAPKAINWAKATALLAVMSGSAILAFSFVGLLAAPIAGGILLGCGLSCLVTIGVMEALR